MRAAGRGFAVPTVGFGCSGVRPNVEESPPKPSLLDAVRREIRARYMSIRTEQQYVYWIRWSARSAAYGAKMSGTRWFSYNSGIEPVNSVSSEVFIEMVLFAIAVPWSETFPSRAAACALPGRWTGTRHIDVAPV